jgi:hypothetical protein
MERQEAEQRVEEMLGWYVHLTLYVTVLTLLAVVNVLTWRGVPWMLFAAFGWGIGLVAHALHVGVIRVRGVERWRQEKIDELLRSSQ